MEQSRKYCGNKKHNFPIYFPVFYVFNKIRRRFTMVVLKKQTDLIMVIC